LGDHGAKPTTYDSKRMIGTKARILGLAAGLALLLAGCGGGGAGGKGGTGVNPGPVDPDDPPRLEGAWSGGFRIGTDQGDARLLVLDDGEFWLLYGGELAGGYVVDGFVQGSGVSANGRFASTNARDFFGLLPSPAGTLEANYSTQQAIGVADFPDWDVEFTVTPVPASSYDYGAPASVADIVGLWPMQLLDGTPVDVTIQPDGTLAGIDSSNLGGAKCRIGGTNVFEVTLQFGPAPCTLPNQVVTGVGYTYTIAGTALRQLLIAGVNGIRARGTALYGTR
jgi:hypothetical protein